jgi:hypothetical protein
VQYKISLWLQATGIVRKDTTADPDLGRKTRLAPLKKGSQNAGKAILPDGRRLGKSLMAPVSVPTANAPEAQLAQHVTQWQRRGRADGAEWDRDTSVCSPLSCPADCSTARHRRVGRAGMHPGAAIVNQPMAVYLRLMGDNMPNHDV